MKQELRILANLLYFFFRVKPFLTIIIVCALSNFGFGQDHQIYGHIGMGANIYQTTYLENFKTKFPPLVSLGFGFYQSEDRETDLSFELTLSNRTYERSYEAREYSYVFFAPEALVLAGRKLHPKIYAQIGAGLSYVVPLSVWPSPTARLAGEFSPVDVVISGGAEYAFSPVIAGGLNFRMGLINMLEFTPIENYGDFGGSVRDIRYRNLQIYLRYYVNKRVK